jgi:hypothetical protein
VLTFLKGAFSDNGTPSSSRLLTAVHSGVVCGVLVAVVHHTHALPDAATMAGLGAFASVHYAVNRVTTAFGKNQAAPPAA